MAPAHDADDPARFDAEYRQAMLLLDVADYEREHGPNLYTRYLKEHGKRPPPVEAQAIAAAVGMQVKADDGCWYPLDRPAQRSCDEG